MESRNMTVEQFESYLMMHKYGMPPHGGLGLGLERFTSKLLNQNNVRLSTLFPRDINRLTP
jgi:nondiscriminating aspartyl-tRNA synthetase